MSGGGGGQRARQGPCLQNSCQNVVWGQQRTVLCFQTLRSPRDALFLLKAMRDEDLFSEALADSIDPDMNQGA